MNDEDRPNRIKLYRKKRGITAFDLAQQLGIREVTLYRYESGDLPVPLAIAHKLTKILGASLNTLFPTPPEIDDEMAEARA